MYETLVIAGCFVASILVLSALKPKRWEIRQVAQERHSRIKKLRQHAA